MATTYDFTDPTLAYYTGKNGVAEEDTRITVNTVIFDVAEMVANTSASSLGASDAAVLLDVPAYFHITGCTLRCLVKDASFKTAITVSSTALVASTACASVGTQIGDAGACASAAYGVQVGASGGSIKLNPGAAADTFKGVLNVFGYTSKGSY